MTTPETSLPATLPWLDALPDPGLLLDRAGGGRVRYANPAAGRHFGTADPAALRGRPLVDLWPDLASHLLAPDDPPQTLRLRAGGPWAWVDVRAFAVRDLLAVQLSDATAYQAAEVRGGVLFDLTAALSRSLTAQEASEVVLRQGRAALEAATGSVFVLDEDRQLVLAGSVGYDEAYMSGWQRFSAEAPTLLGDALRAGGPLFLSTADVDARYPHLRVRRTVPTRTVAALPLLFGGRAVGVLNFGFDRDEALTAPERHFLLALAEQLAQALERARLLAEERLAREAAALLYRVTAALANTRTAAEVARVIAETSAAALGAAGGVVLRLDAPREELVLLGESGLGDERLQGWRRLGTRLDLIGPACARSGEALFLGSPEYLERYPHLRGVTPTQAAAALPLLSRGELVGVLSYGWDGPHTFGAQERALLTALAGQCAQALERVRLAEAEDQGRAALERERARLSAVLDGLAPVVWSSRADGTVERFNARWHDLTGLPPSPEDQAWLEAIHPDDRAAARAARERGLAAGETYTVELRLRTRAGTFRWHLVQVAPLREGPGHVPHGWVGSATDIHDRKEAEEATRRAQEGLARSENRSRALIEATNQYVWTNSPEGEMVGEQPGWARLTGQTPEEYQGYGWSGRLHPEDREGAVRAWHEALRTRSLYEVEQRVRVADGSYRSFLVRAVPLLDEAGQLREWVGLHSDVTDLKRAQLMLKAWGSELERQVAAQTRELRAANEELGAFAYTVSHDLRAPVRHVGSFAGLLRRKVGDDPAVVRYVDQIEGAARRMEVLTDALLGLARAGAAQLKLMDVDLGRLVDAARSDLAPDLAGRKITWRISELPVVRADAGLLRQVFANLLGNAAKYSRDREEAVIEVWSQDESGEIVVAVRDNGAGFDPQYAGRLFGVFQRLHHQHEFEGTGVGLANVRRIVEKHGGRVWASARPGEGATFFFSLPRG